MTDLQILDFCELVVNQVGIKPDDMVKAQPFWKPNLVNIDKDRACESLKSLMFSGGPLTKDAGKWLAAISNHCGRSEKSVSIEEKKEPEGCHRCRYVGVIEVPHHKDWEGGRWKGMYTTVVACECPAGQMKSCQIMNIRTYEAQFPYWQQEYPMRKYQFELDQAEKNLPRLSHRDTIKMTQSKIAQLKAALGEMP